MPVYSIAGLPTRSFFFSNLSAASVNLPRVDHSSSPPTCTISLLLVVLVVVLVKQCHIVVGQHMRGGHAERENMIYPSIERPSSYERTEQRRQYYHGLGAGMGQSTSRPKRQQPEEEGGWGLFHHGSDTISAPKGTGPQQQQGHDKNLAPRDSVPQNTDDDDAPGNDVTPHSPLSQVESTALEDEHDIDPSASHVSDSARGEQSERSKGADEEADRDIVETSPQRETPDPQPDSSGEETGKVETSEPRDETEQEDTEDHGTGHTQEDPKAPDSPPKPGLQAHNRAPAAHCPPKRTPFTWFDMIIDLDHPEPLGPAGYFPGSSTMPDLPPLGPRTSVHVL